MDTSSNRAPHTNNPRRDGVFNVTKAFSSTASDDGVIVSDKRKRHISFGESLQSAFGEWLGKTKASVSELQGQVAAQRPTQEEPVVIPKATERKAVVEKAATFAHIAPKNDSSLTIERIRTFKSDVARLADAPTIKPAQSTTPSWTHTADTPPAVTTPPRVDPGPASVAPVVSQKIGKPISAYVSRPATPKIASTVVPPTARANTPTAQPATIAPVISAHGTKRSVEQGGEITRTPVSTAPTRGDVPHNLPTGKAPALAPEPVSPPVSQEVPDTRPTTPVPQNTIFITPKPATPEPEPEQTEVPEDVPAPEFHSTPLPAEAQQELETFRAQPSTPARPAARWSSYLVGGTVVGGIALVGVALIFVIRGAWGTPSAPIVPPTTLPISPIVDAPAANTVALAGDSYAFLETLRSTLAADNTELTLVYPTYQEGGVTRTARTHEFLRFIGARVPEELLRSFDDTFTLGGVMLATREPFLIFSARSFDQLFAGMLAWETYLQDDLAPLFGEPDTGGLTFTDTIRNNAPVRTLQNADGVTLVTYTIRDQKTLIITTTLDALATILERL